MKNLFFGLILFLSLAVVSCAIESSGKISGKTETMASFEDFIKKGVTTKAQMIEKYGDPASSSKTSEGTEHLTFAEKAPFWETGGMSFLMGRQKIRTVTVILRNEVVEDYHITETWRKRR